MKKVAKAASMMVITLALAFGVHASAVAATSQATYGYMASANTWQKWSTQREQKTAGYIYMKMSGWAWNGAIDFRLHDAGNADKVFTSIRTISYNDTQKKELGSNVKKGVKFRIGAKSQHQCGIDLIGCYNDDRWDGTITWNN